MALNEKPEDAKRDKYGRLLPGYTPNPTGAGCGHPKGKRISTAIRELLKQKMCFRDLTSGEVREMEVADILAMKQIYRAFKGDQKANKMIVEYSEGKPKQQVDLKGSLEHNVFLKKVIKKAQTT
jgi:hypothetical protein